jgi:hypothetical protein
LRLNQLITCASHDLIPIAARGILLFAHSSSASIFFFFLLLLLLFISVLSVLCAVPAVCVAKKDTCALRPLW